MAVALGALAACASDVTVTKSVAPNYQPEELLIVATGDNELRTVIIGNPFDMPQDAFNSAVLASMAGRNFGPRLNLSLNPRQEDARNRHVVLAFNMTERGRESALCARTPVSPPAARPAGDSVTVTGVFCTARNLFLTRATATTDGVGGIDSDQFQRLMTQLTIALFPSENPNRRHGGGRRRP